VDYDAHRGVVRAGDAYNGSDQKKILIADTDRKNTDKTKKRKFVIPFRVYQNLVLDHPERVEGLIQRQFQI